MAGGDLQEFEIRFLNDPQRWESVEFAKALHGYLANRSQPPRRPEPAIAVEHKWHAVAEVILLCAAVFLAGLSVSFLRRTDQLQKQLAQIQLKRVQAERRAEDMSQQIDSQRTQLAELRGEITQVRAAIGNARSNVLSLKLTPGLSRTADQIATADLSPVPRKLRLSLQFDKGHYRSYRIELETAEGQVVWTRAGLAARRTAGGDWLVNFLLPPKLLTRSDYLVMLSGQSTSGDISRVGTYYFRVIRQATLLQH